MLSLGILFIVFFEYILFFFFSEIHPLALSTPPVKTF